MDNFKISYTFWILFWILNIKITNIFKYINLIWIYSDTRNILVWIGFGSGSLDTKILNPFEYLTSSGSRSVLLSKIGFGSILWVQIFCLAQDTFLNSHNIKYYALQKISAKNETGLYTTDLSILNIIY